jgi:hypothetical protein
MIPDYIRKNFNTLDRAFKNGDACLMEVLDEAGNARYLICIHQSDKKAKDGKTEELKPFARLFEYTEDDDPYKLFTPPM